MCPILWTGQLFSHEISVTAYSTALFVATVVTVSLTLLFAARHRLPGKRVAVCVLLAGLAALAGARLWLWLFQVSSVSGAELLSLRPAHFSLWGALVGGGVTGAAASVALRLPIRRLADASAPALAAGIAIMRLGCFGRGCCFGVETDLPWGIRFPMGSPAYIYQLTYRADVLFSGPVPVHPTQLYELAAALVAGLLALALSHCRTSAGVPFLAAALTFLLLRGVTFVFRAGPIT